MKTEVCKSDGERYLCKIQTADGQVKSRKNN